MARSNKNPYPDYDAAPTMYLKDGNGLNKELTDKIDEVSKDFIEKLKGVLSSVSCRSNYTVYSGYCGIGLLFYHLAVLNNNREYMKISQTSMEFACENLDQKKLSFLNGDAGPIAMAAIINHLKNHKDITFKYADRLISYGNKVLYSENTPDELLYGRSGCLYALLLANKYLGDEIIKPKTIRLVVYKILTSGQRLASCQKAKIPLMFEWHNKYYLGAAHGYAGILYVLLKAKPLLSDEELNTLIKPTLDWLVTMRFPGGNFASSVGSDSDRLVQWCHGAPGFVQLLCLAAQVFEDNSYLQMAIECGEVIWKRGILCKGYSLCHGVAGNGYAFLHLYQVTKEVKYWHRAACFAHWCSKYPKHQGMVPDRPDSLYEGLAGMVQFMIDVKNPNTSCFPGFTL